MSKNHSPSPDRPLYSNILNTTNLNTLQPTSSNMKKQDGIGAASMHSLRSRMDLMNVIRDRYI